MRSATLLSLLAASALAAPANLASKDEGYGTLRVRHSKTSMTALKRFIEVKNRLQQMKATDFTCYAALKDKFFVGNIWDNSEYPEELSRDSFAGGKYDSVGESNLVNATAAGLEAVVTFDVCQRSSCAKPGAQVREKIHSGPTSSFITCSWNRR